MMPWKQFLEKKTNYCFKDIKYKLKKVVNHNYVEKLKFCKYSDILQMKISPKNRNFEEDANKQTYMEISKRIPPAIKPIPVNNKLP